MTPECGLVRTRLELPWPPSVNGHWRMHNNQILISKEGRKYRKTVANHLMLARAKPIEGRLALTIEAHQPDKQRRDLDNLCKPLIDALQDAGLFEDDEQIDDLRIIRGPIIKHGRVFVTIAAIEENNAKRNS